MQVTKVTAKASITAHPNPIPVEKYRGLGLTTLSWHAEGVELVEIRVDAPDGALFSRGSAEGSAATGQWVRDGMIFYLQDVSGGRALDPANTLATVRIEVAVPERLRAGLTSAEADRLSRMARYTPTSTFLYGKQFSLVDAPTFLWDFEEIFSRQIYGFDASSESPYIIDGGANIGLSVLYFKRLYPASRIVAFEPDKEICATLSSNMRSFGYHDIVVHSKALWKSDAKVEFVPEGSVAGRIARLRDNGERVEVDGCSLCDYLTEKVDFLKLDIEGAETDVLRDCQDFLKNVENLFVDYHSFVDEPQTIQEMLEIMHEAGFRFYIDSPVPLASRPFLDRWQENNIDLLLNIYAYRPARKA